MGAKTFNTRNDVNLEKYICIDLIENFYEEPSQRYGYGWILIPHPAYSPDLALSDFYLFGKLEFFRFKTLKVTKFYPKLLGGGSESWIRIKIQFRERFERRKDNLSRVSSCKLERILLHRYPEEEKTLSDSTIPQTLEELSASIDTHSLNGVLVCLTEQQY
ncbi:hypothetical protein LAZ67_4000600 [Cordylochernes scorpioides]|uniref:Uncharacterized protein n=1 Tax=Cordylochernes scorpioides TaxID=51811 RepID=A0ABY6KC85_9ARAC|nr:hypothetical protein LAZ67_4000600 [Cordylochernes scorpioides]